MAIKTYTAQLEEVQAAITEIVTNGQSFHHDTSGHSRRLTRADLSTLQQREEYLRPLAARESRGGLRVRVGVPSQ